MIMHRDIIDTEHASGDVNKMLLGSFVPAYDQDEGEETQPLSSPTPYSNPTEPLYHYGSDRVGNGVSLDHAVQQLSSPVMETGQFPNNGPPHMMPQRYSSAA